MKASYIIGAGWWADGSGVHVGSRRNKSSNFIRSAEFFEIWWYFVRKYTSPEKVIIVDSASPCVPQFPRNSLLEVVHLRKNFGHPAALVGHHCGYIHTLFTGAFYALMNSVDYFIFIEQDCLVCGKGWVERALAQMGGKGISFGYFPDSGAHATDTVFESENSLVIMHRDSILPFINLYLEMPEDDETMLPEWKFDRIRTILPFTPLPFGFGRMRPIDFSSRHFYAQHWTEEELTRLFEREMKR